MINEILDTIMGISLIIFLWAIIWLIWDVYKNG